MQPEIRNLKARGRFVSSASMAENNNTRGEKRPDWIAIVTEQTHVDIAALLDNSSFDDENISQTHQLALDLIT